MVMSTHWAKARWITSPDALPAEPGAYALLIRLDRPAPLPAPRFATTLEPGTYVYLGSARGPGGIRARAGRHLRAAKTCRWHVDWLTSVAAGIEAAPFPDETECTLVDRLNERDEVSVPVPGFGSTDCRHCTAHLLAVGGAGPGRVLAWLANG